MGCDGRSGKSNKESCGVLRSSACFAKTFFNETIEIGTNAKAATTFGEVHPGQTVVVTGATESDVVHLLGIVGSEKRIKRSFDCGFGGIN
jgi:hypothetical protein